MTEAATTPAIENNRDREYGIFGDYSSCEKDPKLSEHGLERFHSQDSTGQGAVKKNSLTVMSRKGEGGIQK
jgi:hypothetical protein